MAIPSFKLLYQQEKSETYDMTVKVIGHQWYWEYEYPDHGDFYFESYMIQDEDLQEGDLRLLTVDNPLIIPANKNVQNLNAQIAQAWPDAEGKPISARCHSPAPTQLRL